MQGVPLSGGAPTVGRMQDTVSLHHYSTGSVLLSNRAGCVAAVACHLVEKLPQFHIYSSDLSM
jgi:hypothetical protein